MGAVNADCAHCANVLIISRLLIFRTYFMRECAFFN